MSFSMKLKVLLFLLVSLNIFSQPKNEISIPKGGEDIKITEFTNLYSLYVTKNQEVYNDDKRLMYFEYINYSLRIQKNSIEPWMPLKVLLYADEKVNYKFIDIIKSHIPITIWVYYMTDNIEDLKATSFRLNSSFKKSFMLEEIPTLENENNTVEEIFEIGYAPVLQLERDLYSTKKNAIKKALKKLTNETVVISKNKTILNTRGEVINSNVLEKLIKQNKVLFLKFDEDIFYEDYIHAIQEIKKIYKSLDRGEPWAYVIEISFELEKLLEYAKIKL